MILLMLVQHDRGNPRYNSGDGYADLAIMNSWIAASIELVVAPTFDNKTKFHSSTSMSIQRVHSHLGQCARVVTHRFG